MIPETPEWMKVESPMIETTRRAWSAGRTWRSPRPTPIEAPMATQVSMARYGSMTPSV